MPIQESEDPKFRIQQETPDLWFIYEKSFRMGTKWVLIDMVERDMIEQDKTGRLEWIIWLLENTVKTH